MNTKDLLITVNDLIHIEAIKAAQHRKTMEKAREWAMASCKHTSNRRQGGCPDCWRELMEEEEK